MSQSADPIPTWNEQDRLKAIDAYDILDTPKEEEFEDIVKMAAQACNVPVSLISFVTTDRQWFKARVGTELQETPLDASICSHAILQRELFVVPDTTKDSRFENNPLVKGEPHVRFYAGALLESPEGLPLGTVCVLDYKPRTLSPQETSTLKALARQVMTQLELRRTLSELRRALRAKSQSEERLSLALEASGFIGIWEWDIVHDRVFADPRFVSAFGGEPHWSVEGAPIAEYVKAVHPDDLARIEVAIDRAVHSRAPFQEEYRLVQKDGSVRWIEARGKCHFDQAGRPLRFPGVAVDITQRKAGEQKVREAAERFWFMAESMPQKIWTATPQGNIDFFNRQWTEFTGLSFSEIRDWGWTRFVHPDDLDETVRRWKESLAQARPFEMEQRLRRQDGTYRWHLARGNPMRNAAGELIMWMGSNTDIDDQRRVSENLEKTAAKFRALFDQSSIFAGILTLDGVVLEANSLSLEGCGYRAEDTLGRPFWECGWWRGSGDIQEKIRQGVRRAAEGFPFLETLPYLWADGGERLVELGLHPIHNDAGQIIFIYPTGRDVTERHRAQARAEFLSQLTQKLSAVSNPEEINRIATSEIGHFLGAQRCYFFQALPEAGQVRVLPDWRDRDAPGREGTHRVADQGRPELWQAVQRGPVSIADVQTHPWTQDHLEHYRMLNTRAYTLAPFIHEGRWVACICVSSNQPRPWTPDEQALLENAIARVWPLIERARIVGALRESEEALREANALLGDKAAHLETIVQQRTQKLSETIGELEAFSYSVSHDMRSPLRSMIGFSEILKEEYGPKLDEAGVAYLDRIANASRRMDRLIQDVLHFSRLGRQEVALETVATDTLIRDIIHSYPNLQSPVVDISIRGTLPPVKGNEALLTQCFSNLLENGAKFVADGGKARIEVWGEVEQDRVKLYFQDHGIGMSAEHLDRIFEIFTRIGRDKEGTGIGLAIVRKAALKMRGTISVQSEPGQGSLFCLDLQAA